MKKEHEEEVGHEADGAQDSGKKIVKLSSYLLQFFYLLGQNVQFCAMHCT